MLCGYIVGGIRQKCDIIIKIMFSSACNPPENKKILIKKTTNTGSLFFAKFTADIDSLLHLGEASREISNWLQSATSPLDAAKCYKLDFQNKIKIKKKKS